MNPFIVDSLGALIRWALMLTIPWLVSHGFLTDSDAGKYVEAAAVALVALGLSLWQKYTSRTKLNTAKALAGVSELAVEAQISNPSTVNPSVMTAKNVVPVMGSL